MNSSAQLQRYVGNITEAHYDLLVPTGNAAQPHYSITTTSLPRFTLSIPFLNRAVETWLPYEVWARGLLQILARLPDQPGNDTFDVEFRATISWNIPDRGKAQNFAVVADVRNTKQAGDAAFFDADIDFEPKPLK